MPWKKSDAHSLPARNRELVASGVVGLKSSRGRKLQFSERRYEFRTKLERTNLQQWGLFLSQNFTKIETVFWFQTLQFWTKIFQFNKTFKQFFRRPKISEVAAIPPTTPNHATTV